MATILSLCFENEFQMRQLNMNRLLDKSRIQKVQSSEYWFLFGIVVDGRNAVETISYCIRNQYRRMLLTSCRLASKI